jgi:hypothetical protein
LTPGTVAAGSLSTNSVRHLQRSAATLREFAMIRFEVTGHSDEREGATLEVREAVALTRARVVVLYLVTVEASTPTASCCVAPVPASRSAHLPAPAGAPAGGSGQGQ